MIPRLLLLGVLIAVLPAELRAQEEPLDDDAAVLAALTTPQPRDAAIAKGLAWLRTQVGADGLLVGRTPVAVTSLGLMAHLAAGVNADDPQHGPWIRRALTAVLDKQAADGYWGSQDNSKMYGHGIATLLAAESLGSLRDAALNERLRVALEKAIAVTVAAARVPKPAQHQGGWRYQPSSNDSDLSLSGWQLLSLVAAQHVGITVPEEVITGAVAYTRGLITDDGKVGYQRITDERPALRGLALLALSLSATGAAAKDPRAAGDRRRMAAVTRAMFADPPGWDGSWTLYRTHYDAIGLSRTDPKAWERYRPLLQRVLLSRQAADGHWDAPQGKELDHGPVYATAMAVLSLAVDRQVLPAFAR